MLGLLPFCRTEEALHPSGGVLSFCGRPDAAAAGESREFLFCLESGTPFVLMSVMDRKGLCQLPDSLHDLGTSDDC